MAKYVRCLGWNDLIRRVESDPDVIRIIEEIVRDSSAEPESTSTISTKGNTLGDLTGPKGHVVAAFKGFEVGVVAKQTHPSEAFDSKRGTLYPLGATRAVLAMTTP